MTDDEFKTALGAIVDGNRLEAAEIQFLASVLTLIRTLPDGDSAKRAEHGLLGLALLLIAEWETE